jgi:hypothetical protein
MLDAHVSEALRRIGPEDKVLDAGGWACPFNRAQWILDSEPYETRGFYRTFGGPPSQGPAEERFSKETWIQRDLCDRDPWPFPDKFFDFAICSQTLEDLRDPIGVCRELVRVSRRGYLEVPAALVELSLEVERPGIAGWSHHRWLVDIDPVASRVTFTPKYHFIHTSRRFHLPPSYRRGLRPEREVAWLWWDGTFEANERIVHGSSAQEDFIAGLVNATLPPTAAELRLEASVGLARRLSRAAQRAVDRVRPLR